MAKNEQNGYITVLGSEYAPSESGTIYAQILNADGTPANTATVTLTLFKSDGTKILDGVSMTYVAGSNGIYKYDFVAPSAPGTYIADVAATNPTAYGTDEIHVSPSASLSAIADAVWDEPTEEHQSKGSFGKAVYSIFIRGIKSVAQWLEINK